MLEYQLARRSHFIFHAENIDDAHRLRRCMRFETRDLAPVVVDREILQAGKIFARRTFEITDAQAEIAGAFDDIKTNAVDRDHCRMFAGIALHADFADGTRGFGRDDIFADGESDALFVAMKHAGNGRQFRIVDATVCRPAAAERGLRLRKPAQSDQRQPAIFTQQAGSTSLLPVADFLLMLFNGNIQR